MNAPHIGRWLPKKKKKKRKWQGSTHPNATLAHSLWFIARPRGRQTRAVGSVKAEKERNNFTAVDIEQETLTERAGKTGNHALTFEKRQERKRWKRTTLHLNLQENSCRAGVEAAKLRGERCRGPSRSHSPSSAFDFHTEYSSHMVAQCFATSERGKSLPKDVKTNNKKMAAVELLCCTKSVIIRLKYYVSSTSVSIGDMVGQRSYEQINEANKRALQQLLDFTVGDNNSQKEQIM